MKINISSDYFWIKKSNCKDLIKIMKICLLFLFVFTFQLMALNTNAQDAIIEIKRSSITVGQLINEIEKQTDYLVVYSNREVDTNRKVNFSQNSDKVSSYLNAAFSNTDIGYNFENDYIVLSKKAYQKTTDVTRLIEMIQQQGKTITGRVTDEGGEPIIGATVIEKDNPSHGTVTDIDGNFTLTIAENATLQFTYVGMKTQEVAIGRRTTVNIIMESDVELLDEVIVVGYGTQRKGNLTGSVASIKSEKLTIAPITNVTNMLGGQLAGLKTKQISGIPGSDNASLNIRGFNSPLIIVDGVETSFNNIDASQIESITILKDGAASIYGARAGNGVVLVTLKRGNESKVSISANTSFTYQNSTNLIKSGSSGQRAEWEREAHINANLPSSQIPWTLSEIEKFYSGEDPEYINTDWFSAVVRPWAPQQNHNLSVSGGNKNLKFLSYLGYNEQQTISRHDGGGYNRINLQTTIDAELFDGLTLSSSVNYIKEMRNFTAMNLFHSNYYYAIYDSDPRYLLHFPDRTRLSYAGSSYGNALFVSSRSLAGYNSNNNHSFRVNGSLTYDFKNIEGLTLKAFINYNGYQGFSKLFRKQPDFYSYNSDNEHYIFERKAQDPTILSQGASYSEDFTQQYSISYDKIFNEDHSLSALALHERINYKNEGFDTQRGNFKTSVIDQLFAGDPTTAANNGRASEMGRSSFVGRLNWGYKNKYLIETIFRADASAKFPKEGRWGFFPSISAGWVISEEDFMNNFTACDNIKLRGSIGQSGDDGIGNYQYYAGYAFDMSYILGNEILQGIYSTGLANSILSWEKISIYNLGIDYSFFNRKLFGTIEGFYRLRDGIPGYRTKSLPSTFGAALPLENLNSIDTRGFEFEMGTSGKIDNFTYNISGNIAWARSKWVKYDEPEYEDADQKRIYGVTGKWTDERYGYVSDGLFISSEEISSLDYTYIELGGNESIKPGDVKYRDMNGDKVLDWRDQVEIGKGTIPNWMYGINTNLSYRNIDLSLLFQGAFGYTTYIDLESAPTVLKYENRWTEEVNNKNSLVPRPGSKNPANWWYSDYRNHNTSYIRLKNMAIGYSLNSSLLSKYKINKLRVYVAGTNLLTFSSLNRFGVDPEAPEGTPAYYYPQQRTLSFGLSITY